MMSIHKVLAVKLKAALSSLTQKNHRATRGRHWLCFAVLGWGDINSFLFLCCHLHCFTDWGGVRMLA